MHFIYKRCGLKDLFPNNNYFNDKITKYKDENGKVAFFLNFIHDIYKSIIKNKIIYYLIYFLIRKKN